MLKEKSTCVHFETVLNIATSQFLIKSSAIATPNWERIKSIDETFTLGDNIYS